MTNSLPWKMSFSSRANVTRYSLPDIEGDPTRGVVDGARGKQGRKLTFLVQSFIYLFVPYIYIYIWGYFNVEINGAILGFISFSFKYL